MRIRFDRFELDSADRRLTRDGAAVDLNSRYLDALSLLAAAPGQLVSKARFMDEVWRGVPVTDEALTQCIRSLRRALGDEAARPRFIETVPKHGYRFIAAVEPLGPREPVCSYPLTPPGPAARPPFQRALLLGAAGTIGGGLAGLVGGLIYGFGGAARPLDSGPALQAGIGATSVVLVLLCISILVALLGAAGVSFGVALAGLAGRDGWRASLLGGAAGGLVVGAVAKLLGLDAFTLLLGRAPADITGAGEGALLGAAVGLGVWFAAPRPGRADRRLARAAFPAALIGGAAGLIIAALGGHLLGGSLDQLARHVPGSRLSLASLGALLGEVGFGPRAEFVTATFEGALFAAAIAAAITLARRHLED